MAHTNGHGRPLRIAQISPLYESVPPRLYGGTERVVAYLTDALIELGHEVTVFASGDSQTSAPLVAGAPNALRLSGYRDPLAPHLAMIEEVYRRALDFDILHFHLDYLHYPASRRERRAHVSTLHGRLDLPELAAVYRHYADMPVVSISNSQRAPLPDVAWQATIPHGLPEDLYRPGPGGDYLVFLGRIAREKRLDRAIEIAKRAGRRLVVAAKIDPADVAYYEREIAGLMRQPHVEYIGEIGERDKQVLLGGAHALVFPIDWPEPFGMVMIEAMACGTPVIAYRCGSVPEVLEDGVTGYICGDEASAARAVDAVDRLSRERIRGEFERRFTARRMALDYVELYRRLADARGDHPDRGPVLHPRSQHAHG